MCGDVLLMSWLCVVFYLSVASIELALLMINRQNLLRMLRKNPWRHHHLLLVSCELSKFMEPSLSLKWNLDNHFCYFLSFYLAYVKIVSCFACVCCDIMLYLYQTHLYKRYFMWYSVGLHAAGRLLEDADSRTIFVSNVITRICVLLYMEACLCSCSWHLLFLTGSFCCYQGQSFSAF